MIGVLDAIVAQRKRARTVANGRQQAAILAVLRRYAGRMVTRDRIRRELEVEMDAHDLQVRLNHLERAERIVVDREERPLLYGVLHAQ